MHSSGGSKRRELSSTTFNYTEVLTATALQDIAIQVYTMFDLSCGVSSLYFNPGAVFQYLDLSV